MRDRIERLYVLNVQLTELVKERTVLVTRLATAATDAKTWPDMRGATDLFVSVQSALPKPRAH